MRFETRQLTSDEHQRIERDLELWGADENYDVQNQAFIVEPDDNDEVTMYLDGGEVEVLGYQIFQDEVLEEGLMHHGKAPHLFADREDLGVGSRGKYGVGNRLDQLTVYQSREDEGEVTGEIDPTGIETDMDQDVALYAWEAPPSWEDEDTHFEESGALHVVPVTNDFQVEYNGTQMDL